VVVTDAENNFRVQIEIVMRKNIPHAFDLFPFDGGVIFQEPIVGKLVNILESFAYRDKPHRDTVEFLQPLFISEKRIAVRNTLKALQDQLDRDPDLFERRQ
jgi:hypothetical protein